MNVEYEVDQEKPGPSRLDECLKCGTFYSHYVEYIQHLLLHVERSNPVVYLNKKEVDDYFAKLPNSTEPSKMSDEEANQMEEVDQKPIIVNKVATVTADGLASSTDDDDQMSLCSLVGDAPSAASAAIKPEVNVNSSTDDRKMIKVKSDLMEMNGQPPTVEDVVTKNTSKKEQSGSDSDDKKEGSKSPAKPTTPNLPNIAISVRKSEDLMAQTNYNLIQKRLQELYEKFQEKVDLAPDDQKANQLSEISACKTEFFQLYETFSTHEETNKATQLNVGGGTICQMESPSQFTPQEEKIQNDPKFTLNNEKVNTSMHEGSGDSEQSSSNGMEGNIASKFNPKIFHCSEKANEESFFPQLEGSIVPITSSQTEAKAVVTSQIQNTLNWVRTQNDPNSSKVEQTQLESQNLKYLGNFENSDVLLQRQNINAFSGPQCKRLKRGRPKKLSTQLKPIMTEKKERKVQAPSRGSFGTNMNVLRPIMTDLGGRSWEVPNEIGLVSAALEGHPTVTFPHPQTQSLPIPTTNDFQPEHDIVPALAPTGDYNEAVNHQEGFTVEKQNVNAKKPRRKSLASVSEEHWSFYTSTLKGKSSNSIPMDSDSITMVSNAHSAEPQLQSTSTTNKNVKKLKKKKLSTCAQSLVVNVNQPESDQKPYSRSNISNIPQNNLQSPEPYISHSISDQIEKSDIVESSSTLASVSSIETSHQGLSESSSFSNAPMEKTGEISITGKGKRKKATQPKVSKAKSAHISQSPNQVAKERCTSSTDKLGTANSTSMFPSEFVNSPPKPLIPVALVDSGNMTPGKSYTTLQAIENSSSDKSESSFSVIYTDPAFPSQEDLLGATNGSFPGSQKDLYRCPLCPQRFATAGELEAHSITEGHIICTLSDACAALNFDNPASLAHHQAMVHQAPQQTSAVQRLAAQVDRLPQAYQQYPSQYGGPPQPYNLPPPATPYNGPKLGSQVMLTSIQSSQPHPPQLSMPNLPAGIQVTKRSAAPIIDSTPNKVSRNEENIPNIRLPDSITLVKSQPAPPSPSNNVANMLATRGITMVASGSRQPPSSQSGASISSVSPQAKRLPNVPSAISIVPSRSQNQQRFAVPPAPQQRRNVTNLGTVDLTKDELNGTARLRQRAPLMANALQRRFSCTICDKVYPTNESLQAHMAVHGQKGRFMCEICRVVYTNEAKLQQHKKTVHAKQPETEFVIPICDVNQPGVKEKLLQCGIRHVVQLSSLRNANDSAAFGLPIIPVDLARNEAFSRLDDMGASNILSLGTLRTIYR